MKTLRYGDTGSEVKTLQTALNGRGAGLTVDGDFGAKTRDAVKKFQRLNGLEDDGIAGPKTWAALTADKNTEIGAAFARAFADVEKLESVIKLKELLN